jgi:hypothetical protein
MRSEPKLTRYSLVTLAVASALVPVWGTGERQVAVAEPAPAYELVRLPEGLDSLSSLGDAAERISACSPECAEIVYVWTPRMPLSRSAIPNIDGAARRSGAGLTLVGYEALERYAETGDATDAREAALADQLLAAGALAHAPALVVHDGAGPVGQAILGYKSAEAYASLIAGRLSGQTADAATPSALALPDEVAAADAFTDFAAVGVPGAYFKWVPGRAALAYESQRRVYLLDLESGQTLSAPGTIDFIPTPDGRYFVTPGDRPRGLVFVDADDVFEAARAGRPGSVGALFVDGDMRDQYPSVGILEQDDERIRYRILTSWFEGLLYRDYEIVHATGAAPATVTPIGEPTVPCRGIELSTPIMSQDGLEVAARDEASGTTKVYRFRDDGRCDEVLGLGMPTRKVAWHPSGSMLAFSTPRVRTANSGGTDPGIFVYDRRDRTVVRVADSDGASQLAFPDFVGDDAIVFLIPGRNGEQSRFRVVRPLP